MSQPSPAPPPFLPTGSPYEEHPMLMPPDSPHPRHRSLSPLDEDLLIHHVQSLTLRETYDPSRPRIMPPPSRRRTAHATKESDPPTWGQIKRLSEEAERTVHHQGLPITSILNPFHCYACNHYLSGNLRRAH